MDEYTIEWPSDRRIVRIALSPRRSIELVQLTVLA
jgi:hypothetical protein